MSSTVQISDGDEPTQKNVHATTARGLQYSSKTTKFKQIMESLLDTRLSTLAPRYTDAMTRLSLPYPRKELPSSVVASLNAPGRFKDLNKYLLDGYVAPGIPAEKLSMIPISQADIHSLVEDRLQWDKIASIIARTAFCIRAGQVYLDANHRTATLCIYELAADFGRTVKVDPLEFYTLLSCRDYHMLPDQAIDEISRLLVSKSFIADIDMEQRISTAMLVKELPLRTTIYFESISHLESPIKTFRIIKGLKRADRHQYRLFRKKIISR